MELMSKDKFLKVLAVTRFHFISGLPGAGAELLTQILDQNPRFVARSESPARHILWDMMRGFDDAFSGTNLLDTDTQVALLRNTLDALYHARPLDAVVFDNDPSWMARLSAMARLMPLSRFILVVRDPAAIAAEMAEIQGSAISTEALLAPKGMLGGPMRNVQAALAGEDAGRVLLIDRDKLVADPDGTLEALYTFLGEAPFAHDTSLLPAPAASEEKRATTRSLRRVIALNRPVRRDKREGLPVWRLMPRTEAKMLLA